MSRIILASASPRRKQLLEQIGITFEVLPSYCEEKTTGTDPAEIVQELALQKAADIAGRIDDRGDVLIIGADTIVVHEGKILGKPEDEADAIRMLSRLSDNTHEVFTGVALIHILNGKEWFKVFAERTEVHVAQMEGCEIEAYVKSGEAMDKAGAYGIQGSFARYISGISGDYFNVVGLPLCALDTALKQML